MFGKTLKLTIATLAAASVGSASAGLVGHWKMDETSGDAADSSGNGYDLSGTLGTSVTGVNGTALTAPRLAADATESDALNLAGGSAVTLSAWVTDRTGSGFEGIAGFENTGTDKDIYGFKMDSSDKINWTALPSHGPIASADTLANYAAASTNSGWIHIVGVFEKDGTSTLYVDGAVAASTGSTGSVIADKTPSSLFAIGSYQGGSAYSFSGSIDDVQVYDEALSLAQVQSLFNSPGSVIPEPSSLALLSLGGLLVARRRRG